MHLASELRDFLPKLGLDAGQAGLHLAPHGCELGPHLAAHVRKFNMHFGTELQNLRLHRTHAITEGSHVRREPLESFHGLLQMFYAIRQQFIRHHFSVSTRRSTSTRAFDGRTNARRVPDDVTIVSGGPTTASLHQVFQLMGHFDHMIRSRILQLLFAPVAPQDAD